MNFPRIKWIMYLCGTRNLPHAQISNILQLSADRTWDIEETAHLLPMQRNSGWRYSVEKHGIKSIDEVFLQFVGVLTPNLVELKYLIEKYNLDVQFTCVIEAIDGDDPEVILGKESIAFLAELEAKLCFDLYYYPEDEEE